MIKAPRRLLGVLAAVFLSLPAGGAQAEDAIIQILDLQQVSDGPGRTVVPFGYLKGFRGAGGGMTMVFGCGGAASGAVSMDLLVCQVYAGSTPIGPNRAIFNFPGTAVATAGNQMSNASNFRICVQVRARFFGSATAVTAPRFAPACTGLTVAA